VVKVVGKMNPMKCVNELKKFRDLMCFEFVGFKFGCLML